MANQFFGEAHEAHSTIELAVAFEVLGIASLFSLGNFISRSVIELVFARLRKSVITISNRLAEYLYLTKNHSLRWLRINNKTFQASLEKIKRVLFHNGKVHYPISVLC